MNDTVWIVMARYESADTDDLPIFAIGTTAEVAKAALDSQLEETWRDLTRDGSDGMSLRHWRSVWIFEEPEEVTLHKGASNAV